LIQSSSKVQNTTQTIRTIDIWGGRIQFLLLAICSWIGIAPGVYTFSVSPGMVKLVPPIDIQSSIIYIAFPLIISGSLIVALFRQYQLAPKIDPAETHIMRLEEIFIILDKSSNRALVEPTFKELDPKRSYPIEFMDAGGYKHTILRLGTWRIKPFPHALLWLEAPFFGSMLLLFVPIITIFGKYEELTENGFFPEGFLHQITHLSGFATKNGVQLHTAIYMLNLFAVMYVALWLSYIIYKVPVLFRNLKMRTDAGLLPDD
jgi:hypothetical protein